MIILQLLDEQLADNWICFTTNAWKKLSPAAAEFYPNLLNENDSNKASIDFKWTEAMSVIANLCADPSRLVKCWHADNEGRLKDDSIDNGKFIAQFFGW